ncbi:hypothetical protein MBLNU459_g4747t1 [Dothideomycetes sp. NU459]
MASGIPGIDRAAMEKERLARLGARTNNAKRLRSISPPATSRPAKQAKTGQNQVHGADDESPIRQGSAESHSKAIEVIALDSTISPLPRKSTSTQQDAHANAQPAKSQLQFPNGVVKKTWAFGHDRNGMDIKLEEVLEKQTLKIGVLSAFQWDTDWVMSKVGLSHSKLIFVMQAKEPELRQQMLRETEDLRKSLRLCFPPMEGQVNCMHSKLMLLFHPQKLRIAVPSANLVKYDWGETGEMENSVFIIDLPRWEEGRGREAKHDTTSFGRELMRFLEKQGLDEDVKQGLLDFDFAATRRYSFVHSIGGASYDQDMQSTGFAGLGAAVREHDLATAHNLELDFAASSIGSLNDEFLCIMHAAARGETPTDHPPKPSSRVTKKAQALPDVRDKAGTRPESTSSPVDRKRKRPSRQQSTSSDKDKGTPPLGKQQTIQELFSTQHKPSVGLASDARLSPDSKKPKRDLPAPAPLPLPLPSTSPQTAAPPKNLPQRNMYSFSSKFDNSGVVDLTNSPPRQPNRRLSGVKRANFNPHAGPKKLVVKNLKPQSAWDANKYFDQTWQQLDAALTTIFAGEAVVSMEDLYRGVENLCRQGRAQEVNAKLLDRCRSHIKNSAVPLLLSKGRHADVEVLQDVLAAWSSWNAQTTLIRCIFYYMDRSYLLQSSKASLSDVAVQLFRDGVFNNETLNPKIIDGACDLISADRVERDLDTATLRQAINMFHDLATYTNSFEPRLLAKSQTYIVQWAEETSAEQQLSQYVKSSVQLMAREVERCDLFGLDQSTRRDLLALLEDHLVAKKVDYLSNEDSVADLLDENAVADLGQLYALLDRKRLGAKIRPAFEKWIGLTGTSIVFDDKNQDEMVVRLLSLKTQLDTIWRTAFNRDEELGHTLRESFETFINKTKKGSSTWGTDNSKPGEMIAKYVDQLLRGGAKAIPAQLTAASRANAGNEEEDNEDAAMDEDGEVNSQLDQVLDLFRFVHGKAVFEAFYKKDLARRLLMGRSASADAERSMLARLKTECGAGFTQNLEQMFKDVELAREEMSSYKSRLEERQEKVKIDLSVNVLSAAAWPTYPEIPVIVPVDIKNAIDGFERHYKSKHSGRKLEWKHALAHCQMKASFAKGSKELVVSSFQAIVLLLFNDVPEGEHLPYSFIATESGLPEAEVKRTLQSLACAKLRPLSKHPKGREIDASDTFSVNAGFGHEKYRVKINQVQLKETKEENKETHERVAADRNFECQAAVVRIMKSRKTIGHSELIAEVITATRSRGVLDVKDIKKNIDRLIEKDYMEREEGNMYNYVA